MFKRWSASVFVAVFLFIFSNPLRSLLFLVCSLCLTPTPLLLGKAYSCVYYCLFTITMSEWVTVDDHWRSKCLSGSRRCQIKTRDGCKYTDWHMGDSQRKVTTELRGTRERTSPREEIEETEKGSYFEMLAVVVGKVKENSVGVKCSRTAGRFTARGDCHGRI